jgi:putative nucleotidyltransferase with HDIG domain
LQLKSRSRDDGFLFWGVYLWEMENNLATILSKLPGFFRYVLLLAIVMAISFLFPNNLKFKYDFQEGEAWRYEDLIAPFDFAIRKTDGEIAKEKEALARDFSPYYEMQLNLVKNQKRVFGEKFNEQLAIVQSSGQFEDVVKQPEKYRNYGRGVLDRIFDAGIIQLRPEHSEKGKDFVINIIKGNTSYQQTVENVYTVETASNLLSDSLPYAPLKEPDFLFALLETAIAPNIFFSDTLTQKFKGELLSSVSTSRGMVRKGELIIPKGGYVAKDVYPKLLSFKYEFEKEVASKKKYAWVLVGYFLLTTLIVLVFFVYLRYFAKEIFRQFHHLFFVFMWLVLFSYLVYVVEKTDVLSAYMIPFCIVPIIIKNFFNARLALITHIVVVLIASFLSSLGYEFTLMQVLAGIVVIVSDVDTRDWSRFFYSMLYLFASYAIAYLGLALIEVGEFSKIDWSVYTWLFLNAFLTLLAYPLVPLLERLFGFTSSITLMELSDMNKPLLKELSLKAPGTLQHSLQVANLAEAAAMKIGANELLVKVAALYHDVGKTLKPKYFIENNPGKSLHDDIDAFESAQIIIEHVTEGIKMAKKAKLPKVLIDFIATHHGTTRVEYFYRNYLKDNPDAEVDESKFRYPGPKPTTKEQTIMMIADSIEAACKSLKNPSDKELFAFIDKIVAGKINHGQLEESEISFKELEEIVQVFKNIMKSVYHVRIEYPEEQQEKEKDSEKSEAKKKKEKATDKTEAKKNKKT